MYNEGPYYPPPQSSQDQMFPELNDPHFWIGIAGRTGIPPMQSLQAIEEERFIGQPPLVPSNYALSSYARHYPVPYGSQQQMPVPSVRQQRLYPSPAGRLSEQVTQHRSYILYLFLFFVLLLFLVPVILKPAAPTTEKAAHKLVRLNQLDPAQYNSQQDFNTWAYSACSTASMTVVINSYGHHYRIADILKVEAGLHEITPDLGLVEPQGIDHTVAQFGFKTEWLSNTSLDNVIKVANQGHPVIVGFPPALWSGGHLLVVRGGNSQSVFLADSSRLNMQVMARATFMKYWAGFAVVVEPA